MWIEQHPRTSHKKNGMWNYFQWSTNGSPYTLRMLEIIQIYERHNVTSNFLFPFLFSWIVVAAHDGIHDWLKQSQNK